MVEAVEQLVADPHDELGERRVAAQVDPQHERRQAVADDRLEVSVAGAGRRRSRRPRAAPRVAAEEQRPDRGEHLEEGRSRVLAEVAQAVHGSGASDTGTTPPRKLGTGGLAWSSGSVSVGSAAEVLAPVLEPPCDPGLGDPVLLPAGVVGVLGRGFGERRRPAGAEGVVERGQLGQHHPVDADAVEDQVVHRQIEPVVFAREPKRAAAEAAGRGAGRRGPSRPRRPTRTACRSACSSLRWLRSVTGARSSAAGARPGRRSPPTTSKVVRHAS